MDWYRWWHGTYTDPKFQMVADDCGLSLACVLGIWSAVLEQASINDPRGSFKYDKDVLSFHLGIDVSKPVESMKKRGLLDVTPVKHHETPCNAMKHSETLHVNNWEKRQPKRERNDNSTERVKAYRERKKQVETPCNATKRHVTPRLDKSKQTYIAEDFSISDSVRKWAAKEGFSNLDAHLAWFKDWAKAGAKQYTDWDATFRNAIRGDWAKVGAGRTAVINPNISESQRKALAAM